VVARVCGGLVLLGGTLLVLRPFLVPMAWAAITAYVTWPLYRRARAYSKRPQLMAALFTAVVVVVLGIPAAWFLVALADQGSQLVRVVLEWLDAGAPLPAWIAGNPTLGPRFEALRANLMPGSVEITGYLSRFAGELSNRLVRLAGGVARNVLAFGVMLLTLFAFYLDGERLIGHARRLAVTVLPAASPRFLDDVGAVVRAVVFGLLGTAVVQGVLSGLGLALFGVPSPVALGALTAVLSFVPMGPVLVWAGASAWLYFGGQLGSALGMALWGLFLVSSVDNVLRPLLISRSGVIQIPFLLIFFGVLGGLVAFGALGLFVGPVLLSVTFALIAEFPSRQRAAPSPAPSGDTPS
jgi:predicted PurR-regulated permease PerM